MESDLVSKAASIMTISRASQLPPSMPNTLILFSGKSNDLLKLLTSVAMPPAYVNYA